MKILLCNKIVCIAIFVLTVNIATATDSPIDSPNIIQPHTTPDCPVPSQNLHLDGVKHVPGNGFEIIVFYGSWRNCLNNGDNQMVRMLLVDATPSGYTFCTNEVSFISPKPITWYADENAWNQDHAGAGKMGIIIDAPFTTPGSAFTARNRMGADKIIDAKFATGYFRAPSSVAGTAYTQCLQEARRATQ